MPRRSRKAVMIVEDDPRRRRDLYEVLRLTRVDVVSSADGDEAMRTVRREHPELILLNMFSDQTGGLGFLKELRHYGMGQKIIVLGMVGDESAELHKAASRAGADKLLERNPLPHVVLELILGYLKVERIDIPKNMQVEIGSKTVDAAPEKALKADDNGGKVKIKPIVKDLNTLLRLTEDAGKGRA